MNLWVLAEEGQQKLKHTTSNTGLSVKIMKYRTSDNQHTILIISEVKIKMMEVELYNNLIFPEGSVNVLREIKERCCTDGSMKCGLNT